MIRETTTAVVQLPDVDKVQLQRVGLVNARQPTGTRVKARCRARGRRNNRVSGDRLCTASAAGVRRHITILT